MDRLTFYGGMCRIFMECTPGIQILSWGGTEGVLQGKPWIGAELGKLGVDVDVDGGLGGEVQGIRF